MNDIAAMATPIVQALWEVLSEDVPSRWSAGLAIAGFAPPLPKSLHSEVHRQLSERLRSAR